MQELLARSYGFWLEGDFVCDFDTMLRLQPVVLRSRCVFIAANLRRDQLRISMASNKSPHPRQRYARYGRELVHARLVLRALGFSGLKSSTVGIPGSMLLLSDLRRFHAQHRTKGCD